MRLAALEHLDFCILARDISNWGRRLDRPPL